MASHQQLGKLILLSALDSPNVAIALQQHMRFSTSAPNVGYLASGHEAQRQYFSATQQVYASFGAQMDTYCELTQDYSAQAFSDLLNCDMIHLAGGDTFGFLQGVIQRQVSEQLVQYYLQGGSFIGLSAGAMLLTDTIATAPLCGDNNAVGLKDLSGLGLYPNLYVPHVTDPQALVPKLQQFADDHVDQLHSDTVVLASDNDVIVYSHGQQQVYGQPLFWSLND
ncbi:peptidase S51 [Shewanella sp. Scap07]|uniref:Type 1 glutamine amidotransferase-like domain-containing protein n=1 Tax=Shewanella sp. Scap07 TaxID=2589987 RepID=UPI0015C173EF|nr:Type 1 glutamine amidotransferase-like domain-containing protein [Shewanella sp. Scap07]QLE85876.1 peptidase S51 [Shewanella sp. Scap07]